MANALAKQARHRRVTHDKSGEFALPANALMLFPVDLTHNLYGSGLPSHCPARLDPLVGNVPKEDPRPAPSDRPVAQLCPCDLRPKAAARLRPAAGAMECCDIVGNELDSPCPPGATNSQGRVNTRSTQRQNKLMRADRPLQERRLGPRELAQPDRERRRNPFRDSLLRSLDQGV